MSFSVGSPMPSVSHRFLAPLSLDGGRQTRQFVAADLGSGVAAGIQQGLGGRVAFGVDSGGVQAVLGLGQAQEARALLIGFGAEALDPFQLGTGGESPSSLTPGDDILAVAALTPATRRSSGALAVFRSTPTCSHSPPPRRPASVQALLGHIVLVLPNADGLGIDLHQLCQRVLQAAGDGNGAAQVDIVFRELLGSQLAGRVDRRACLADDHVLQVQFFRRPVPG